MYDEDDINEVTSKILDDESTMNLLIKLSTENFSKLNIETANEILEIVKRDLESSKCDYKEKRYDKSIINLQQSIEKLGKAWGIFLNLLKDSKTEVSFVKKYSTRKVSHDSPKSIYKPLELLIETIEEFNPTTLEILDIDPEAKGMLKREWKNIAEIKQKIARWDTKEISNCLLDVEKMLIKIEDITYDSRNEEDIINKSKEFLKGKSKIKKKLGREAKMIDLHIKKILSNLTPQIIEGIVKVWMLSIPILLLSILTFSHTPRYHDHDPKPKDYVDKKVEIVYSILDIIDHTKKTIDIFEECVEVLSPSK